MLHHQQQPLQRNAEFSSSHIALDIISNSQPKIPQKPHFLKKQYFKSNELVRYRPRKLTEILISPRNIQSFKQIRSLRSLNIDLINLSSSVDETQILSRISQASLSLKHLEEVHLNYWPHDSFNVAFLTNLFSKMINLRRLKILLSGNRTFLKRDLYEFLQIIRAPPSITAISIEYSHTILLNSSPGPLLQTLKFLPRLESLSLKFRSCSTDKGIPFIHLFRNHQNFKSLKSVKILFDSCDAFSDGTFNKDLKELANNLEDLTYLKSFNLAFKKCSNINRVNIKRMHSKISKLKSDCEIKFEASGKIDYFDCFRKCCKSWKEKDILMSFCNFPCVFTMIFGSCFVGVMVYIMISKST